MTAEKMSDDIVTRLRRHAYAGVPSYTKQLDSEAADEIEYLKERCARLERTIEALMEITEERRDEFIRLKKELANDG